jgi:Ca-activated chloride channel family protein
LGQLNEADRFSIVGFDHRLAVFHDRLQPVNRQSLADARQFVSGLTADGNTDLAAALQTGLQILNGSEPREATAMIVFLTDGLPTAGVTDESLITHLVSQANASQAARLHVFGVGYDVNTHLLDRLAAENGGTVTYVQPGENLETVLTKFYGRIAQPVLTDLTVEFEGWQVNDRYPQQLPDLFSGSSLVLTGRYRAEATVPVTVRVRGRAGGQEREYQYTFTPTQQASRDFVPRLWATRRVGALLDQVRVLGETPALVEEIRGLGLDYGLVTPYTTFIIEAQTKGVASAANMELYADKSSLNQVSGRTTIQARVQNQAYQQSSRANLAQGANVVNYGRHSLAQVTGQSVDLAVLKGQSIIKEPITPEWLARNIKIDQEITFGSEAYFALADDPTVRPLLQGGINVIFTHQGQIIAIQAPDDLEEAPLPPDQESSRTGPKPFFLEWLGRRLFR